jgi:hypothetical protein
MDVVPEIVWAVVGWGIDGKDSIWVRSGRVSVNFRVSVLPLSVKLEILQPLLFLRSTSMPLLSLGKPKTWN